MWLGTNQLTEFNLLTGKFVRAIADQVEGPCAITPTHGDIWEFNVPGTLAEFSASSGKFLRSVDLRGAPRSYEGYPPLNMVTVGNDLWIPAGSQAFMVSSVTGKVLKRLDTSKYDFDKAMWVTALGNRVWFVNLGSSSVTELNESSAGLVAVDRGSPYAFENPQAAAVVDGSVWVTNSYQFQATVNGSLTVFPAT
jgi:hypothetical protein